MTDSEIISALKFRTFPKELKLSEYEYIHDVQTFVETNISIVEKTENKAIKEPYMNELRILYKKLSQYDRR